MRCKRCNRRIWVHESVKRGFGPVCAHIKFLDRIWWQYQQRLARGRSYA